MAEFVRPHDTHNPFEGSTIPETRFVIELKNRMISGPTVAETNFAELDAAYRRSKEDGQLLTERVDSMLGATAVK